MEIQEWAFWINADEIEKGTPSKYIISPSEHELEHLARRLGVAEVHGLSAELEASRIDKRVVHVTGHVQAEITQECVVTLEPVRSHVEDEFEAWFANSNEVVSFAKARHEKNRSEGESDNPILDEKDDPEPIIDGKINLGELSTQYLILSIDPYPTKGEIDLVESDNLGIKRDDMEVKKNPFSKLKELRLKQSEEE